ncbi:MAG TPA: YciI family protein [Rhodospirillaceae bacterium]|nr:YciI family protein [Rhodospirillaceae bacterium]
MLYFVHCIDKPDSQALRLANRAAHLEYAKANIDKIIIAGPTLTEDGQGMTGSVFIVDFPDRAAVETHFASDPYVKAGLFEALIIRPYRKALP